MIPFKFEQYENEATAIMKKFLADKSEIFRLKNDLTTFYNTSNKCITNNFIVKKIQTNWKERMELDKAKIQLLTLFWEKEKIIMTKYYFQKHKKSKKAK